MVAGFLAPIAGALNVLGAVGLAASWSSLPFTSEFEARLGSGLAIVVALAVVLLGPGDAVG